MLNVNLETWYYNLYVELVYLISLYLSVHLTNIGNLFSHVSLRLIIFLLSIGLQCSQIHMSLWYVEHTNEDILIFCFWNNSFCCVCENAKRILSSKIVLSVTRLFMWLPNWIFQSQLTHMFDIFVWSLQSSGFQPS